MHAAGCAERREEGPPLHPQDPSCLLPFAFQRLIVKMVKQKESLKNSRRTSLLNFLFSPFFKRVNEINLKKKGPEIVESGFLRLADETVRLGVMSLYEHLACFPQSLCVCSRGPGGGRASLRCVLPTCPKLLTQSTNTALWEAARHLPPGSYHVSHPAQFLINKGKDRPASAEKPFCGWLSPAETPKSDPNQLLLLCGCRLLPPHLAKAAHALQRAAKALPFSQRPRAHPR